LAQLHVIEAWQIQFVKDSTGSEWKLTAYGIVACVLVAIVLLGGLCSIIMLFTMASPYKITDKVSKLSSSALSGRKNSSAASRTTGERY
jgi:hypothetical protein